MSYDANHTIRTVLGGTLWRLLRFPFLLLSLLLIPRIMGVGTYGQFALFMSVTMISESIANIGNLNVFGRFLPEHGPDESTRTSHFLHGILFYSILVALAVTVIVSAVVLTIRPDAFPLRWLVMLGLILVIGKTQGVLFSFMYGRNQIGRFSSRDLIRSIFKFAFVLLFFLLWGLEGALWALVGNEVILSAVAVYWTRDYLFRRTTGIRFSQFKPYLLFGLAFYVPSLLYGVLQPSGNIFIRAITHSSEQVSYFDIANQFRLLIGTLLGLVLTTLVPSLTKLHVNNETETVRSWLRLVLLYSGIMVVFVWNALLFMGEYAVTRLIDPAFAGVHVNAIIMALSLVPFLIMRTGTNFAILKKEPGAYAKGVIAGIVVVLIASLILIPDMGSVGASWSVLLGQTIMALVFYLQYRKDFANTLRDFFVAIGLGLLILAPFHSADYGIATSIAVCAATSLAYVCILFVLRIIRVEHARKILDAIRSRPAS